MKRATGVTAITGMVKRAGVMPSMKNAGGPSARQLERPDVNQPLSKQGTVRGYIP